MKIIFVIALLCSSFAFGSEIAGVSNDEAFGFSVSPYKITGTWGSKSYSIEIFSNEWRGSVGEKEFKTEFWKGDVTGMLPCGEVKIGAWATEVEGVICGGSFVTTTGNQRTSNEVAYDTALAALLADFPIPVQGIVRAQFDWNRPASF